VAIVSVALAFAGFSVPAAADTTCTTVTENASNELPAIEVIRERYPDGVVKIEREVTTDAEDNYVNHGAWRMWKPTGELVAEGRYEFGKRVGPWTRTFDREDAAILSTAPFDQFKAPFLSRATFHSDQLDGEWTIADADARKCSCVTLKNGKRNGAAWLWLPTGEVYREATFRNGLPVGELRERGSDGELKTVATYVGGQQLMNKVINFPESERMQLEAECIVATTTDDSPDDFWELRFAEYSVRGEDQRHGRWRTWYSNGQMQAAGFFQFGRESGEFTWWHANGQEAAQGTYVDGRPDGRWTWWHPNGQKATDGQYSHGEMVGLWRTWADDGRLVQRVSQGLAAGEKAPMEIEQLPAPIVSHRNVPTVSPEVRQ
jgi:antitoxin component YwqK of YwqJK toxin-antitoxin module